jgi:hypothetical protein
MTIRNMLTIAALALFTGLPAAAASFHLTPDVPVSPTGVNILPWDVARHNAGAYGIDLTFAAGTPLDALHRMDSGYWLISVESPTLLGGATWQRQDVIRFGPADYAMFFDGLTAGLPVDSDIDAVFLVGGDAGDIVISFDVPTIMSGTTYEPADLVRFSGAGSVSLFFDASSASPPIPVSSNVTGAALLGSSLILTFDVPTTLGAVTYVPGELVSWNGAVFAPYHSDAAWSAGRINGLSMLANPGAVSSLTVAAEAGGAGGPITLSWTASCSAGADDYAIYEGVLGDWYSHIQIDCHDDDGDLTETTTPGPGSYYYLVVPHNAIASGSYGFDGNGMQRPPGLSVCVPAQVLSTCP